MKAQKPSISPLHQRMIEDMRMRKLGDRTQERMLNGQQTLPLFYSNRVRLPLNSRLFYPH